MSEKLAQILENAKIEIDNSKNLVELVQVQGRFTGKKSYLTEVLKAMKDLDEQSRKKLGKLANETKQTIINLIEEKQLILEQENITTLLKQEAINITLPGYNLVHANHHPLMIIANEISQIFQELGYDIVFGKEVESDEFNFQRLNIPKNHPARDMQDTFYISENSLLRTHCTNMTAHTLSNLKDPLAPIAVVSVGNVYRRDDDDATHSHQFMQVDGFLVAKDVSFANLKWTLQYFCQRMFGENSEIRMRPSFFPFTEPSVEVDVTCVRCTGKGCNICKQTGWIEILGAGMLNPKVFEACNIKEPLQGFAFGLGIERVAMIKYGIYDIRQFYTNDLRFLQQFNLFN